MKNRKIIIISDGDIVAKKVIEKTAKTLGARCISSSGGNPTQLNGEEIVEMILQTPFDPVLVMFDDNGHQNTGKGEKAMEYIAKHPDIEVIGAIAVASNTKFVDGITIDFSVDRNGKIVKSAVNKDGEAVKGSLKIYGDTVDILERLDIPVIVGIGDIGKMDGHDHIENGSQVTHKAVQTILKWGEQYGRH